jgi:membrane protease YdiL (CAAX protease family)
METNNNKEEKESFIERYEISHLSFGIISLIVIFILYQRLGGSLTLIINIIISGSFHTTKPNLNRITTALGQLMFLLVPTLLLAKLLPDNFKKIFKLNKISFTLCLWIILSVFALGIICEIILLLQSQIPLPEPIEIILYKLKIAIEEVYKRLVYSNNISELGFVIVVAAIVPALCEEFLFRGLLQHAFTSGLNARKGVLITGLLFAGFHFDPFSFIALAMIGIYLCFLVYKTNSIISSMLAHFTNNLIAVSVPYFLGRDDLVVDSASEVFTIGDIITLCLIFIVSLGIFITSLFMVFKKSAVVSPVEASI